MPQKTPIITCLVSIFFSISEENNLSFDINKTPKKPIKIATNNWVVKMNPRINISKIVVWITSVFEKAIPIAKDRRVNNFIRRTVNKIWQMLAKNNKDKVPGFVDSKKIGSL